MNSGELASVYDHNQRVAFALAVQCLESQRALQAPSSFPFVWESSPSLLRLSGTCVLSSTCNSLQTSDSRKSAHYQEDIAVRMLFIAIIRAMTSSVFNRKI